MKIFKFNGCVSGYGVVLNQKTYTVDGVDYKLFLVAKMLGKDGFRCQTPSTRWICERWVTEANYNQPKIVLENFRRLNEQFERFFSKTDYFHPEFDRFEMDPDLTLMKQFEGKRYDY
ncbi:MAG TPA: hypothetical protein VFM18_01975 [Methanosarcina sp.]|nr:hypothetical protein [Methanosarcina sp.]